MREKGGVRVGSQKEGRTLDGGVRGSAAGVGGQWMGCQGPGCKRREDTG
jgi:hypothetical protein